jgi:death on curing protein
MPIQYLELADYLLIVEAVLNVPAEQLAEMPHLVHLAESALAVPRSGWGGRDAYPEFAQKAALMCARLARNHPLPDGNKRAAWLAMVEFIERNGRSLRVEPGEADLVVDVMLKLAAGEMPEKDFVTWVQSRLMPYVID